MSTRSSRTTSGFTATHTTRPNTTDDAPNDFTSSSSHSNDTGDSPTRGGATRADGSRVSPAASNSLSCEGNGTAVTLTCCASGSVQTETTNSPVSRALRSESFAPIDVNCTTGGMTEEIVKYECGARLSTPAVDRVETHAIGRGTTRAFSRW